MKVLVRSALFTIGVLIAGAGSANAQLTNTMKFTTTFPFVVSGKTMPAGAYTATRGR
jgi:hypothetical protein